MRGIYTTPYANIAPTLANYPGLRSFFQCNELSGNTLTDVFGYETYPTDSGESTDKLAFSTLNAVTVGTQVNHCADQSGSISAIESGYFLFVGVLNLKSVSEFGAVGGRESDLAYGSWRSGTDAAVGILRSSGSVEGTGPGTGSGVEAKLSLSDGTNERLYGWFESDGISTDGVRSIVIQGKVDAATAHPCYASFDGFSVVDINATGSGNGDPIAFTSFAFGADEGLYAEATDLYGCLMYSLSSPLSSDTLVTIGNWCKTNWVAGNKEMPSQLLGL